MTDLLQFHTEFAEYSGATAGDIIRQLYEESQRGVGSSFDEWWSYQQKLWAEQYDEVVPARSEVGAEEKLLEILKRTCLEEGPRPGQIAEDSLSRDAIESRRAL